MIFFRESVVHALATYSARKESIHNKQDQGYDILEKFSILSEQNQMFLSVELICPNRLYYLVICTKSIIKHFVAVTPNDTMMFYVCIAAIVFIQQCDA